MRLCPYGGYVVSGSHLLPDDLTDHATARLPAVGCNQLRCPRCGCMVRTVLGFGRDKGSDATFAQIYDAPDLTKAPGIVKTLPDFRFYVCRCTAFLENGLRRLVEEDVDLQDLVDLPWRCAGHPEVTLPHAFDGVTVEKVGDLPPLVERLAGGWLPDGVPKDYRNGALWLLRLHYWLPEGEARDTVVRETLQLLEDAVPRKRGYALAFLGFAQPPEGKRRALELLEGDRAGFAGVPDEVGLYPHHKQTLEDGLWLALHGTIGRLERARQLARREVLTPGKGSRAVYDPLVQYDIEWLIEHAAEIVRTNPTAADLLLKSADYNSTDLEAYKRLKAAIVGTAKA